MKQNLVIIGNGMAGVRCAEEILKINSQLFNITIIGSEDHPNYNRILLSSVLQGNASLKDITINGFEWYEEKGINLLVGETAIKIDTQKKVVLTDLNQKVNYDKLIIATGSNPFILPIPGAEKDGVVYFRTIEDCKSIIETSKSYKKAVVIGGGVLGLEAARGLLNLGVEVTVVHNTEYLMQRQLDSVSSGMLQKKLEEQGMEILVNKVTQQIVGGERVAKLIFTDGSSLETDLVVMAAGVVPNTELAKDSGIPTNRGILVNNFLQTQVSDIYAVGECVEHNGFVYGLVKPLYEQGRVLARHICGYDDIEYKGSVLSTSLKVPGIDLFSVGDFGEDGSTKALTMLNEVDEIYKKIVVRGDIIVGAVLFGDTADQSKLLDAISKRKHVNDKEKRLFLQSSTTDVSLIKSMKLSEIICNCNGVTKGTIMDTVQKKGLTTVEQVKQCTKASGSCGSCKGLVGDLLSYIRSDECDEFIEPNPLCDCTYLTEDEVVIRIQQKNLMSLSDVFEQLEWKRKGGCSNCVPAISYYLAMIYPANEGESDAIYLNETLMAQLQEDGTYSIIPQMYGGTTSPKELKRMAELIEKYKVTSVGITSDQRIQINGITKEDIKSVCTELGLRLTSRHVNTIRHVNTLFGEQVCQCRRESALQLAVELEKQTENLLTPHKVLLGVSACKHKEAEVLIKDIGVIGVNRGWEIYVGGSISPNKVTQGELFTVASDKREAKQLIVGFIQYYRETANYLESIYEWIERISLIHIREVLFESSLREQLVKRLQDEVNPITEKLV